MPLATPDGVVALVARQAGTANAFASVADALEHAGIGYVLVALGEARALLGDRRACVLAASAAAAEGALAAAAPRLLLTGTSFEVADDAALWRWARSHRIPSAAFVDSHSNPAVRFTVERPFDAVPETVLVSDERARDGLLAAGCPTDTTAIEIVGNPAFDVLATLTRPIAPSSLLFVGQPTPEASELPRALLSHVLAFCEPRGLTLRVRPHPREAPERYAAALARKGVELDEDDRVGTLARARAAVGLSSTLLVEAALAGVPVVSYQPPLLLPSGVVLASPRVLLAATSAELPGALSRALALPLAPPRVVASAPRWLRFLRNRLRLSTMTG